MVCFYQYTKDMHIAWKTDSNV